MTDDLEHLLARTPAPIDPAAKEALFRRTARTLARKRLIRRATALAAVGLVFSAGAGMGWLLHPTPETPVAELIPVPVPVPVPDSQLAARGAYATPLGMSAPQLELEAEKSTDPVVSAKLFRQAGDKYLADSTDIASATRCYAYHLAEAGPAGLAVSSDDSWLLIRLKASRTKENGNEPNAGT